LEHNTQTEVEDAIFEEVHKKQYDLAKEAPICSSKMFEDFWYLAITPASKEVLDVTYIPPLT
jgi:hypothetical protein